MFVHNVFLRNYSFFLISSVALKVVPISAKASVDTSKITGSSH